MTAEKTIANTRPARTEWYVSAMERLVDVVQELSMARDMDTVVEIVRRAARDLTGADGATFVLRDGDKCFYMEENAISPLWKGQRFPLEICISGWVMMNAKPAVIEDIYKDPRIPHDAYRPTFVKSLAMVPIRMKDPVGAIGNYWATNHMPNAEEIAVLQALANVTSVAIENAGLYTQLQEKIKALEESNHELGRFAWAASHDLKSPLRAIGYLSERIETELEDLLDEANKERFKTIGQRTRRMEKLLDDILAYAKIEGKEPGKQIEMADGLTLIDDIKTLVYIPPAFVLKVDKDFKAIKGPRLVLQRIFCNLVENAIKHHDKAGGIIIISCDDDGDKYNFTVRDDGPGIAPEYHERIFDMFQTLKPRDVTEGSGMGLSFIKKILDAYESDISVESDGMRGAAFHFDWPKTMRAQA